MSDNPDNGLAEDEGVTSHLLALLYADEGDSQTAGESDYQDAAELSGFRSVLGHFRDLPEEEPPAAISNKLLALAAQEAPAAKKAVGKGFFERISDFLLPAVYHPGLASAATLVLVAGLGATLYVNGKGQVAEPMVATHAAAPSSNEAMGIVNLQEQAKSAAPQEESPSDMAAEAIVAKPESIAPNQAAATALEKKANKERADDSLKFKAGAKRDPSLDALVGGAVGGGGSAGDMGVDSKSTGSARKSAAPDSNRRAPVTTSTTEARRGPKSTKNKPNKRANKSPAPKAPVSKPKLAVERDLDSKDKADPEPTPAADLAPPPPAPGTTPTAPRRPVVEEGDDDDDDDAAEGEDSEAVAAPQKKPDESKIDPAAAAAALHKKAITAATRNQCSTVKSLGRKIRKLSSSYYDRTFLSDKRLTACLAPDVKK